MNIWKTAGRVLPNERRERLMRWACRLGCFVLVLVSLGANPATAADTGAHQRAFVRALELFDSATTPDGYRASARELETIVADGVESGAVYYNLGNAYFRAGEYGRAILNYRKAKPYRPRDSYLEANLQQALASAPGRVAEQPSAWWSHVLFWTDWLSFPSKVRLAGFLLAFAAMAIVIAVLIRKARLTLIGGAMCLMAVAVGTDVILNNPKSFRIAVITSETTALKGTGKDYEPAFDKPLQDGAEFTVLSETSDWTFGHFEGIGDGWVRNEFVAR